MKKSLDEGDLTQSPQGTAEDLLDIAHAGLINGTEAIDQGRKTFKTLKVGG